MSSAADDRALLVATRNAGKSRELRALLAPLGRPVIDLLEAGIAASPEEDALEDAPTFEGNASAKARYFARVSGGRAVLADDSGLCVFALGGAPGVRSRRYVGETGDEATVSAANSAKLLRELAQVDDRRAEFVCALAYVDGPRELVALGTTAGRILRQPIGSGGFGYDPLFFSDDLGQTFAEATEEAKGRVSHRARAIAALLDTLGEARSSGTVDARAARPYTADVRGVA